MIDDFLNSSFKQFEYYRSLGDKTFAQLSDEELFMQLSSESNSIGVIVKHLWGNMLSRWTDFLHSDGEKEWRKRDLEFQNDIKSRTELLDKWNEGWDCLFQALNTINEENFNTTVYIRNQGHSIVEAIQRQLAHYAYHVGQIVFIGVTLKNNQWTSLSIPRGDSSAFNAEKFSKPKRKEHFTDEFLKNDKKENPRN